LSGGQNNVLPLLEPYIKIRVLLMDYYFLAWY
jgi:hypothetical protein